MAKETSRKSRSPLFVLLLLSLGLLSGASAGYYVGYDHGAEKKLDKSMNQSQNNGCQALTIVTPTKGEKVTSPLTVTAIVDNTNPQCRWTVFEAQAASMELTDGTGQVIGNGLLTTTEEWMTEQPVNYTGTITFTQTPASNDLTLTVKEEDPSGQGSQQLTLPLTY